MPRPIITLTTDYGTGDHLVGAMKGVILNINPDVNIVDITHDVMPYDVLDGAMTINEASRFYSNRTIHVVVVDPGVGTERRPLLVTAGTQYYIGPDNGVMSMVYEREKESLTVRHITSDHYFMQPLSRTFHGRDIFAPVAAWLSKSWQTNPFGEEIEDYMRFNFPRPKANGNTIKGIVLRVDAFGNLLTNLTAEDVPGIAAGDGKFALRVGKGEVSKLVGTFADGAAGEAVGVFGSSGYLEVAVNKGNAARVLGVNRGAEVVVEVS